MSLVTDLLAVVDVGGQLEADFGLRLHTATVRVEQYDRPLGDGAVRTGVAVPDVVIAPAPRVRQLAGERASWHGAGTVLADATGEALLTVWELEATRAHATGGYTEAQLLPVPSNGTTQRTVILLTGPGLRAGGEPFAVAEPPRSDDPTTVRLTLVRVPIY